MNCRKFLQATLASTAAAGLSRYSRADEKAAPSDSPSAWFKGAADAMILIWLPGGVAQTDTWDPKKHTPYEKGMKASQILGTCPAIQTSADGIQLGAGLETIASMMDQG